ncbi:MAG: hypothetical protein CSA26_07860 [Desulfobacterales bacterium]|nr:MAG: hypothetical protein CSA26_07860 [Desulfobacterales bacterium]
MFRFRYIARLVFIGVWVLVMSAGSHALAAEVKIGVMNLQKILSSSVAGKAAKEKIEARGKELQEEFKSEETGLKELQKEIEKKSTAWSEEKKKEKALEFQKKRRELKAKSEDARFELKNLQEKELAPIIKALEEVIKTYGKANGYTVILDLRSGIPYFDKTIDVSDKLVVELDAAMAK